VRTWHRPLDDWQRPPPGRLSPAHDAAATLPSNYLFPEARNKAPARGGTLTSAFVEAPTFASGSRASLRRIRPKIVSERLGHAASGITSTRTAT